jgi:hypothetical protein
VIKDSETYPNASVTNEQFTAILKKHLPNKSANDISDLVSAAEKEQPNEEQIGLAKLFSVVSRNEKVDFYSFENIVI